MNLRARRILALLALTSVTVGCLKEAKVSAYPVRGSVMYKGKPATGVVVVLRPLAGDVARPSSGTSVADGTFQITTFAVHDGAPAGEYVATLTWPKSQIDSTTGDELTDDLLKGRYADPAKSSRKVTVREGDNLLDPFILD
jgi:hypothetical protein